MTALLSLISLAIASSCKVGDVTVRCEAKQNAICEQSTRTAECVSPSSSTSLATADMLSQRLRGKGISYQTSPVLRVDLSADDVSFLNDIADGKYQAGGKTYVFETPGF